MIMNYILTDDYIPLNSLLKLCNLVNSGGEANIRIINGEVLVNNKVAFEKRKKIRIGDTIKFNNNEINIVNG